MYSTRTGFRELWAEETLFWRKVSKKNKSFPFSRNVSTKESRSPYVTDVELFSISPHSNTDMGDSQGHLYEEVL